MPASRTRILVVDDDRVVLRLFEDVSRSGNLAVRTAGKTTEALETLADLHPSLVFLNIHLQECEGFDLLDRILSCSPTCNVVVMTAQSSIPDAVESIRRGAQDYLEKPFSSEDLRRRLERWTGHPAQEAPALTVEELAPFQKEGVIASSPKMLWLFDRMLRVAPYFHTALVLGQTGTGKEAVANMLHKLSPASKGPFVVCNSAAVVDSLFESEFFGHVKGAFTGAGHDKRGLFEAAHSGTLFLDEIAELSLPAQAKLLRALQEREVVRVGSTQTRKVDVRIIAATNKDLRQLVKLGGFREDLLFRLSAVELTLPSLSERQEDIPLLIRHFIRQHCQAYSIPPLTLSRDTHQLLMRHSWSGNVRELANVLGYACMVATKGTITTNDLPEWLSDTRIRQSEEDSLLSMDEVQLRHAQRVLARVNGNRLRAAEILGISRATLYRLLSEINRQGSGPDFPQFGLTATA